LKFEFYNLDMIACLFDIDGTLLSSGGAGKHAMYAAITSEFGIADLNDGVPFAGRTDRAIGRDLFLNHGMQDSGANWHRFVRAYLEHLPHSLHTRPGCVLPGVAALLEKLRQREDVAIGLLTGNLRNGAHAKLAHYGIDSYFQFGGFGDDHLDRCDVAREAIGALAAHVGTEVAAQNVWVIGDTPLDIQCARSVGARVLAVCTGFHAANDLAADRPDLLLPDLSETSAFVAALGFESRS
jgi:phosphoglycolate phosphatase-like HAD superfamily hydrolase